VGDPAGREEPLRLHGREKEYHFVAFAPDGKTLLSGGDCYGDDIGQKIPSVKTIAVWDTATGRRLRDFRVGDDRDADSDGSASVALSPDGKALALGYWDYTVRLWDVTSGKPLRRLPGYPDRFYPATTWPSRRTAKPLPPPAAITRSACSIRPPATSCSRMHRLKKAPSGRSR
jgi:WD40 repeat protein